MKQLFIYWIPLIISTALFWAVLSGHFSWLFVLFAAFSIFVAATFVARAGFVKSDELNLLRPLRFVLYIPWLLWNIVKSNIDVGIRILRGNQTISPLVFDAPVTLKNDYARVLFAQSISICPSTTSMFVFDDKVIVHALSHDAMDDLVSGRFEQASRWYEGTMPVTALFKNLSQ